MYGTHFQGAMDAMDSVELLRYLAKLLGVNDLGHLVESITELYPRRALCRLERALELEDACIAEGSLPDVTGEDHGCRGRPSNHRGVGVLEG